MFDFMTPDLWFALAGAVVSAGVFACALALAVEQDAAPKPAPRTARHSRRRSPLETVRDTVEVGLAMATLAWFAVGKHIGALAGRLA